MVKNKPVPFAPPGQWENTNMHLWFFGMYHTKGLLAYLPPATLHWLWLRGYNKESGDTLERATRAKLKKIDPNWVETYYLFNQKGAVLTRANKGG